MDTLQNLKAFADAARTGSFSEAARQTGVSPSVITKRIDQLEWRIRATLFTRSTRKLTLTEVGERFLPRIRTLVGELEETLDGMARSTGDLEGHLRVKVPTTLGIMFMGKMFGEFLRAHPRLSMETVLADRSVNPVEESFDMAIGALPELYGNVVDEPLCRYPRMLYGSPEYLQRAGAPRHPRELVDHDCLVFIPTGALWSFESPSGSIQVDVRPRLRANDSQVLLSAAREGNGLVILADYIAQPAVRDGTLVPVLADFTIPGLWLKALIPENRLHHPRVQALLHWLKRELCPVPPWERETSAVAGLAAVLAAVPAALSPAEPESAAADSLI